ncbi:TlpA family protein disulfide reductase [Bacillus sp. BRMEA1]|uniref:TlpA disulfide reductase family protein n=1 Tax=Neobacillus endophyticus TaxID=2738405 RepID=UPI001565482B|nr:TlpA disulfide reductase family protein [Neobacillus endophyticus]NRD79602.1 TlpA family protein disulfide reductase [Neobacillus endophyticus]
MFKKVLASVVLISLLTVAIVQAMDKNKEKPDAASKHSLAQKNSLEIGAKAPDFELKTLTGETVKLSSLKGKKVMLNFWATWCPPCKAEMPEIEQFYKTAGNNTAILSVNIDPQLDVKGFVKENKITFPILLDTDDKVNGTYQIISIPTTYFIDSNGIIQNKIVGQMKLADMNDNMSILK